MKTVGKTNRPLKYDLKQFPYDHDHTVEVTNRFKGLNLIDRVDLHRSEEIWTEVHNIVQEVLIKTIPKKKKCKKAKWLSEEALQTVRKKRSERQRRKGKINPLNTDFQELQGEIRKPS